MNKNDLIDYFKPNKYAVGAGVSFVLFEFIFWMLGIYSRNNWMIAICVLISMLFFIMFAHFMIKGVALATNSK